MRIAAALGVILLATAAAAVAVEQYDRDAALAISQDAIGKRLENITLRDVDGRPFDLASLSGRPFVISLIYTSCHHVCPITTRNVARNVEIARDALGQNAFSVITVGFDWKVDTPHQMRMYASTMGIDEPDWYFLSGDAASVQALSDNVGFQFHPSAKGFDHLSQTTIVDARGFIYRQVYGADFETTSFVEPLKELVFDTPRDAGLIAHWVGTFKLFCTVYDPNSGRYQFDYSIFMTILIGVLCLGAILAFVVHEWRHAQ